MSKQHAPVFRTAISGFNKTDVNMYIAKLARDFGEQKAALEDKASRTDAVAAELERANALISAKNSEITALRAENERMKAQLSGASVLLENALDSIKSALSDTSADK